MEKPHENATVIERITFYVQTDQEERAKALATLCDHLEECFLWEIEFNSPD